ncbi:hypothetical protein [Paenibacillus pini]|nr:hypothetical protein [Paenibacillus pini]
MVNETTFRKAKVDIVDIVEVIHSVSKQRGAVSKGTYADVSSFIS